VQYCVFGPLTRSLNTTLTENVLDLYIYKNIIWYDIIYEISGIIFFILKE